MKNLLKIDLEDREIPASGISPLLPLWWARNLKKCRELKTYLTPSWSRWWHASISLLRVTFPLHPIPNPSATIQISIKRFLPCCLSNPYVYNSASLFQPASCRFSLPFNFLLNLLSHTFYFVRIHIQYLYFYSSPCHMLNFRLLTLTLVSCSFPLYTHLRFISFPLSSSSTLNVSFCFFLALNHVLFPHNLLQNKNTPSSTFLYQSVRFASFTETSSSTLPLCSYKIQLKLAPEVTDWRLVDANFTCQLNLLEKLARRLWTRPLCNAAAQNNVCESAVCTHMHYTHQHRHLAQSRCCPQWVRERKKDETGRQLGWGGQPRWTDPVGKPQGGRHTTPAAYLLNVRFERL